MIDKNHILLALTGASGAPYAIRLLQCLLAADQRVDIIFSKAAHVVFAMETDLQLPSRANELTDYFNRHFMLEAGRLRVFGRDDWMAPMASGSYRARSMVVCPCTTGTLAAIAHGNSDNLIERAADVMLKESRQLILVPRETPLSVIHLENMLKLARLGVIMLPPNPGFYHKPKQIDDLIDFTVARILDQLQIKHDLMPVWGENNR